MKKKNENSHTDGIKAVNFTTMAGSAAPLASVLSLMDSATHINL